MEFFEYEIKDETGLHARPSGMLVKKAASFSSSVRIIKGEKTGDAKKIFSVMSMGIKKGDKIRVETEGEDEKKALLELKDFFTENL